MYGLDSLKSNTADQQPAATIEDATDLDRIFEPDAEHIFAVFKSLE